MCCITYSLCDGSKDSFAIGDNADGTPGTNEGVQIDSNCSEDYVGIEGVQANCNTSPGVVRYRLCGIFSLDLTVTVDANKATSLCGKFYSTTHERY